MAWERTVGGTTVERFAAVLVLGGVGMVAGLWILELAEPGSGIRLAGIGLVAIGGLGVTAGLAGGLDIEGLP